MPAQVLGVVHLGALEVGLFLDAVPREASIHVHAPNLGPHRTIAGPLRVIIADRRTGAVRAEAQQMADITAIQAGDFAYGVRR